MLFVPGGAHEKMDHGLTRETISGAFIKHLRYGGKCKGGNARRGILFVLLSRGILLLLTASVIPDT